MKRTLSLLLLALPALLSAQNMNFGELVEVTCEDGSTVMQPDNWTIYQTLDNTWDGVVDPSWCVNVEFGSTSTLTIEAGTFDPERPLFAHGHNPEDGFGLIANELYNFRWQPGNTEVDHYNTDFCDDGWCSGVKAAISVPVPDDPLNPVKRWYQANFSYDEYWWGDMAVACAPSEYMDGQIVSDVVYMAVFPTGEAEFNVPYCDIYWDRALLNQENIDGYRNGNDYNLDNWNMNWIISYDETDGFPSLEEQSFIDLSPEVNTSSPEVVNLNIGEFDHIIFQPFAFVRGGFVEGSDSIRHNISINNFGSANCVQAWLDVWIEAGNRYFHQGGPLMFGPEGCFMFRPSSILEIEAGKTLDYGPDGTGILGLTENAKFGSTLEHIPINNKIALWDAHWIQDQQQIEIPLPPDAPPCLWTGCPYH